MSARRVLVVDDDELFCEALADVLGREDIDVAVAHNAEDARARAAEGFAVAILDNKLGREDGLSLVPELARAHPRVKVILCTGFPQLDNAVAALRLGLFDYLSKPVDLTVLVAAVRRGLRELEIEQIEIVEERRRSADRSMLIVGENPSIVALRDTIERAAQVRAPVLITGETGTGKTLVARAIHHTGSPGRAFVHVNCAALPQGLVESELFGSERGSFTGASQTREGLFELADGGTLFLDEVGELDAGVQAKLLMAIEEGWIRRVGGTKQRRVDARIIAATNADVEGALARGTLRADLYYRLNVVRVELPPLRARPEDLPALSAHLLSQLPSGRAATLAPGELEELACYDWPGNTRELRNVLERALVLQGPALLRPSLLLKPRSPSGAVTSVSPTSPAPQSSPPVRSSPQIPTSPPISSTRATARGDSARSDVLPLVEVERRAILAALDSHGGNRAHAARSLGVSVATLRRKLREYGLGVGEEA